jgi:capsule polysaccharide export protein KpsC/LpsZ
MMYSYYNWPRGQWMKFEMFIHNDEVTCFHIAIQGTHKHSSDIRNTRIFRRCSKRSIFKYFKIWKCEYVKYVNTMSKTLSKLSLSCAQTQRQRWSNIFKYFQVFFKKPKKTYNTRMFELNWEYVTTMHIKW